MKRYQIVSQEFVDLGTYEAETPEEAHAAMMADAGYTDPEDYPPEGQKAHIWNPGVGACVVHGVLVVEVRS